MFINNDSDSENVTVLGTYHPYRVLGARNPKFDAYSSSILNVKNLIDLDIQRFYTRINALVTTGIPICYVPSCDSSKSDSGIRRLAIKLAQSNRIDATGCLIRHTTIPKLARGGNRNIRVHLDSIRVESPSFIKGKRVLLIDDVTTTHNSLTACKQLLLEAGASEVYCLALGQTALD